MSAETHYRPYAVLTTVSSFSLSIKLEVVKSPCTTFRLCIFASEVPICSANESMQRSIRDTSTLGLSHSFAYRYLHSCIQSPGCLKVFVWQLCQWCFPWKWLLLACLCDIRLVYPCLLFCTCTDIVLPEQHVWWLKNDRDQDGDTSFWISLWQYNHLEQLKRLASGTRASKLPLVSLEEIT